MVVIKEIKDYLETANETIEYINTKSFKNKILKEDWKKMKWEDLIVLTTQKAYNKFSWKDLVWKVESKKEVKDKNITKSMTNFQKWVYFLLKKDIR